MTERITEIIEGVTAWLADEEGVLSASLTQTVNDGLFPEHDVRHMIGQVRETVTAAALTQWYNRYGETDPSNIGDTQRRDTQIGDMQIGHKQHRDTQIEGTEHRSFDKPETGRRKHPQKILCLHAGNLPMVGLQDLIAVLLSGNIYYGKLSRKDPWLLDGLLRVLQKRMPECVAGWSTNMDDLVGIRADGVLFAGSEASVGAVTRLCYEKQLAAESARFLYRTARLSMALLTPGDFDDDGELKPETGREVTEAILRYDGKGCRSVAVIIAPYGLKESAEQLVISRSPESVSPAITYWKSYLESIDQQAYITGPVLITDNKGLAGMEKMVCWISNPDLPAKVRDMAERFGRQLQNVYVTTASDHTAQQLQKALPQIRLAPLSQAQSPPIDWEPDGMDVLNWLMTDDLHPPAPILG